MGVVVEFNVPIIRVRRTKTSSYCEVTILPGRAPVPANVIGACVSPDAEAPRSRSSRSVVARKLRTK